MTEVSFAARFSRRHLADQLVAQFLRLRDLGHWDGVVAMIAPDLEVEDLRQCVDRPVPTSDALNSVMSTFPIDGGELLNIQVVAERGTRLALVHVTISYPPKGIEDMYCVMACAESGLIQRLALFDGGDLDVALARLARDFASTLDPVPAGVMNTASGLMIAIGERDYTAIEALTTRDLRHVDRRHESPITLSKPEVMDLVRSVLESDREVTDVITEIHHVNGRGVVASRSQARARPDGRLATDIVLVAVRNSQVDLVEFFDDADLQLALLRLEAVTSV
ncbi:MAG: hypothetical protein AAF480_09005 [Actinomycetota bacterium]